MSERKFAFVSIARASSSKSEGMEGAVRNLVQMSSFAARSFALAAVAAAMLAAKLAANAQVVEDDGHAIRAIGDGKFFIGDCTGKSVQLIGDRQTIVLLGTCGSVVSHGSHKRITVDAASSLRVIGDGNIVKWKVKPPSVNASGRQNLLSNS